MAKQNLAPPPLVFRNDPHTIRWVNDLIKQVSGDSQIDWSQIDLTDSDHDELNGREEVDPTSADTTRNKHVANSDLKSFQDHIDASSAHGVTGDIVGTGNFAAASVGGVVFRAAAVTSATSSTVSVTSTDAGASYTSAEQDLINELKADVNQLKTDLNDAITVINNLLGVMRSANQLSS